VSLASTPEQRALTDAVGAAAARCRPIAALRAQDPAGLAACWTALAEVGVFGVALPAEVGGAGGTVPDAAAALQRCAAELVPGPVLPTVLAGLLLADLLRPDQLCLDQPRPGQLGTGQAANPVLMRAPSSPHAVAKELLPAIADGAVGMSVAFDAKRVRARRTRDGWALSGELPTVLGTGRPPTPDAAALLLVGAIGPDGEERWFALDGDRPGVEIADRASVDLARPVARVTLRAVEVSAERELAGWTGERVRTLAVTLAGAEAAGLARWCLDTATEHARVREQFGRPIGSFQAVKHLCVGMLCRVEQAEALAWDAARVAEENPAELPLVAAATAAFALDAAVDTAKDAIQVLGGIGFTWEHDAHLYLRRALANRALLGPTAGWRARLAELARAGARRTLTVSLPGEVEAERPAVRAEVEAVAALPEPKRRAALADAGLLAPHWPAPYGRDASPARQLLIDVELRRAGVDRPDLVIGGWAVPTLLAHGTPEQVERFALPTLRGEITWCQLFSEPEAGSDLAGLRTRAERVAGGWRLTGQKVWTSLAHRADWAICLARTDPDAPKHRGISYFLVDMRTPGIEIRALREITGESMFNEVFLDGVFVPDECVVGAVNGGWALARTTLANERVAMSGGSSLGEAVERLLTRCGAAVADPGVAERLGGLVARGLAVSLLDLRATLRQLDGHNPGAESSVRKLVGVAHRQEVAEVALELAGAEGAAADGESAALVHEFLLSRCLSIAGGTTQVLMTLAGERLLGLPRERS
jgi:alkylation response protein AidB-like acyl-CoA dehydrogenase